MIKPYSQNKKSGNSHEIRNSKYERRLLGACSRISFNSIMKSETSSQKVDGATTPTTREKSVQFQSPSRQHGIRGKPRATSITGPGAAGIRPRPKLKDRPLSASQLLQKNAENVAGPKRTNSKASFTSARKTSRVCAPTQSSLAKSTSKAKLESSLVKSSSVPKSPRVVVSSKAIVTAARKTSASNIVKQRKKSIKGQSVSLKGTQASGPVDGHPRLRRLAKSNADRSSPAADRHNNIQAPVGNRRKKALFLGSAPTLFATTEKGAREEPSSSFMASSLAETSNSAHAVARQRGGGHDRLGSPSLWRKALIVNKFMSLNHAQNKSVTKPNGLPKKKPVHRLTNNLSMEGTGPRNAPPLIPRRDQAPTSSVHQRLNLKAKSSSFSSAQEGRADKRRSGRHRIGSGTEVLKVTRQRPQRFPSNLSVWELLKKGVVNKVTMRRVRRAFTFRVRIFFIPIKYILLKSCTFYEVTANWKARNVKKNIHPILPISFIIQRSKALHTL